MWKISHLRLARVYGAATPVGKGAAAAAGTAKSSAAAATTTSTTSSSSVYNSNTHKLLYGRRARTGALPAIANDVTYDDKRLRQQLNHLLAEERDPFGTFAAAGPAAASAADASAASGHVGEDGARYFHPPLGGGSDGGSVPRRRLVDLPGVERVRDLPADPLTRLFFQHKGEHALYYGSYDHPSQQDTDRVQIEKREPRDWSFNVTTPVYDFCHRIREGCEQRKRFVVVPSTLETRGCAKVLLHHGLVSGFRDFHNDRAFAVELKYFQNEPTISVIEPCSYDGKTEFEWSPKMMRRLMNSHGIHNRIVVYVCRTADNRVIDHIQAVKENIGGRGLIMAH